MIRATKVGYTNCGHGPLKGDPHHNASYRCRLLPHPWAITVALACSSGLARETSVTFVTFTLGHVSHSEQLVEADHSRPLVL
jgi:hypothetical protein